MKDILNTLSEIEYSGRGIILGMTPDGKEFIAYSLTGRSDPSQARRLEYDQETQVIRTEVTDKKQLEKGSPALLLYPALIAKDDYFIASNGGQTDLIYTALRNQLTLGSGISPIAVLGLAFSQPHYVYDSKEKRFIDLAIYEPDQPIYTPRISACIGRGTAAMHIVSRLEDGGSIPYFWKYFWNIKLEPGKGKLLMTYKGGNEKPLVLSFDGEPLDVKIESNIPDNIVCDIFNGIQHGSKAEENFGVAAAVLMRFPDHIQAKHINRYDRERH
ncbi:MAG: IMP cyclohydrolase [Nanoarchaeota archaeon]|nr:IMP cyclohydrolase [Nanoarchaeota archaeon]